MAFPTPTSGRVDKQLTNISLANTNEEYIHDKIFPVIGNLKDDTGLYGKFGNEHLRVHATSKRGVWDESQHRVDYKQTNDDRYAIDYYDLEKYVPDRIRDQFEAPFDARRDALFALEAMQNQIMEASMAGALFDTAIMTNNSTPATKWDADDSTPLQDMEAACDAVRLKTGRRPNKAVIGQTVINNLKTNAQFLARVNGVQKLLGESDVIDIIKNFLKLKTVLVGSAIYVNSKEGQTETTADIWGEGALFYYAPDNASLMTPSLGYRLELAKNKKRVDVRREPLAEEGDLIKLRWAYQDLITDVNSGHLVEDCLT